MRGEKRQTPTYFEEEGELVEHWQLLMQSLWRAHFLWRTFHRQGHAEQEWDPWVSPLP